MRIQFALTVNAGFTMSLCTWKPIQQENGRKIFDGISSCVDDVFTSNLCIVHKMSASSASFGFTWDAHITLAGMSASKSLVLLGVQTTCEQFHTVQNFKMFDHPKPDLARFDFNAYMRQWNGSALVQIMACRLSSAKPLSKAMLGYYQLDP